MPGWDIEIVPAEDAAGAEDDGHDAGGAVAEIIWSGGSLPDNQFQEFGLSFRITEDAPEVIYLPTIQECEQGEHRWIEIPSTLDGWGDLDEPAPYVVNNLAGAASGSDDGGGTDEQSTGVSAGSGEGGDAEAAGDDSGVGPLPVIALIAGLLGLAAGLAALTLSLRAARR